MRKIKKRNVLDNLKEKLSGFKKEKNSNHQRNSSSKRKDGSRSTSKNSQIKNKDKKSSSKSTIKKEKVKRRLWKKIVTAILILGIIGVLMLTAFFGYIAITAPKFSEDAFNVKDQTVVYDINGEIIATLGIEKRESVTYDQLPQVLIDAIIATEDSRFFQHNGVDLPRFIKATAYQLIGKEMGGASTLTMQTVKNNLTKKDSLEKSKIKKIIRKFQDVYLAVFKVEKKYSKEEIIELYVNNYGLGSNVYGVGEAAKYYFGKSVSDLTLPEATVIAGLFQAPNGHNPYKNMKSATARRETVLNLMVRHGYITKEESEMAKKVSIESLLADGNNADTKYQGFIDVVADEVEDLTGNNPYVVPMKIYTTMEKNIQDGINSVLENNDAYYWKDALTQAGIAIINVETGAISAVGAGRNRTGIRTLNYATGSLKQPGSTAKPIFDYGPGIEYNNFSSYTLFNDEPWTYTNGPSVNNWDGGFQGLITTRQALQVSRNIPALKAFQQVGPKNSQKFAYSLGLDVALNESSENYRIVNDYTGVPNTINEAYSIGGVAEGFSPLMMASAYAGFASGGYYTAPYSVTKIEYRETGEVKEYKPTKTRVMKDSTAYIMNNILESAVTSGFPGGANVSGSHVAAKTGTTNYDDATMKKYKLPSNAVSDLWTVAYTSKYSVAVWYGYKSIYDEDAKKVTYNISSSYKDDLMKAVIKYIPKDTKGWSMPSSVVKSEVEKETWPAKLPSKYTPSDMITTEYFVRGTQPTEISERYNELNDISHVKTTQNSNSAIITWEYTTPTVLTETYLKEYFNNSLYGKQKDHYLQRRIDYNNNTLGTIGFGIYKQNEDGTLTLIDYVNTNKYTYNGFENGLGNVTLVIKAEHKNFKSNASPGVSIKLNLDDIPTGKLTTTLNGKTTITVNNGTYTEEGFKSIEYTTINDGTVDVLNSANTTIKYQITSNGELKEFEDKAVLEQYINSLPTGTYKITYIVKYLSKDDTKTRTITIR